jgi:hypothetical protein
MLFGGLRYSNSVISPHTSRRQSIACGKTFVNSFLSLKYLQGWKYIVMSGGSTIQMHARLVNRIGTGTSKHRADPPSCIITIFSPKESNAFSWINPMGISWESVLKRSFTIVSLGGGGDRGMRQGFSLPWRFSPVVVVYRRRLHDTVPFNYFFNILSISFWCWTIKKENLLNVIYFFLCSNKSGSGVFKR